MAHYQNLLHEVKQEIAALQIKKEYLENMLNLRLRQESPGLRIKKKVRKFYNVKVEFLDARFKILRKVSP